MNAQIDNAAAAHPADRRRLSSHSHSTPGPTSPSRTVIDLSSPTEPAAASPLRSRPGAPAARPPLRHAQKSQDEQRLIADFNTPADAVECPDPQTWNPGAQPSTLPTARTKPLTMKPKPGAQKAYKPIDTLDDGFSGAPRGKSVTYSKSHRPAAQSIGRQRQQGQTAYLESMNCRTSAEVARNRLSPPVQINPSRNVPSPVKRRKITHTIEINSDDEVLPASQLNSPRRTVNATCARRASGPPSQSQVSTDSGRSGIANRKLSHNRSEFLATESLFLKSKRSACQNRAKEQGAGRPFSYSGGPVSSPVQGTDQRPSITLSDDEQKLPRQQILRDIKQGVTGVSSNRRTVTSEHFPNARINESTSPFQEQPTSTRSAPTATANLRSTHRPVPRMTEDVDDSADELAWPDAPGSALKRSKVLSKASQAANSVMKRKKPTRPTSQGFPLHFARSHDFAKSDPTLRLKPETDGKYSISSCDIEHNLCRVGDIDLRRVNVVVTDHASRIRLTGSRDVGGNVYTIDLEFADPDGLTCFLQQHIPFSSMSIRRKEALAMQSMFDKELDRNDKVGKLPVIDDTVHGEGSEPPEKGKHSPPTCFELMKSYVRSSKIKSTLQGAMVKDAHEDVQRRNRKSTRPTRSTGASTTLFDLDQPESRGAGKYSIDVGLGQPWKKPLEYGQGRQRATVHFEDLARLDEEEFLNDSLIDFYMIYLFNHHKVPSDKIYFFNTYFFTALTKNTGRQSMNYANVARWTGKVDIFGYDYIVIPINEATHWYLAIICNVSSIARKPVVEEFDAENKPVDEPMYGSTFSNITTDQSMVRVESDPDPVSSSKLAQAYENTLNGPQQREEEDANLFEESSQIHLLDPNELGSETKKEITESDKIHETSCDTVEEERVGQNATRGILGAFSASSKTKKAVKRRFVQPKKDPDQPIIIILDSLGQTRSGAVRALKDWLSAEGKAKRGMEAVITEKGYYPKCSQIPTQDNWSDCGVFLLGYVEKFFKDPDTFKCRLLAGEMSAETDWPELEPKQMRTSMRNVIVKCADEANVSRLREKKAKLAAARKTTPPAYDDDSPPELASHDLSGHRSPLEVSTKPQVSTSVRPTKAVETPPLERPLAQLASPFQSPKSSSIASGFAGSPDPPRNNVSAVLPIEGSPAQSRTQGSSKRRSPEVRVASFSEKSQNAPAPKNEALPRNNKAQQLRRPSSESLSHTKEQRRDTYNRQSTMAASERNSKVSPQQQAVRTSVHVNPSAHAHREGSAPTAPIEILDSQQEPSQESTSLRPSLAQPSPPAQSHAGPSTHVHTLRPAASLEEIRSSYFYGHAKHQHQDEEVAAHAGSGREDMQPQGGSQSSLLMDYADPPSEPRSQEPLSELMDVDSPAADAMDVDTPSRGSEIAETPEPEPELDDKHVTRFD